MDPTNPFAGLPPPNWSDDDAKSPVPQLEPNNPFFNNNPQPKHQQQKQNPNNYSTPGAPQPTNPFFTKQQAAIQKFKKQQQQEEYQQQYAQQKQQQQQAYVHQAAIQQHQAMQQQYYRMQQLQQMQSMHNLNTMRQQQSVHNLNLNTNAMSMPQQASSFHQPHSPQHSPQHNPQMSVTNPFYNQPQQHPYYNPQLSPQSQQMRNDHLNAFKHSLEQDEQKDEQTSAEKAEAKRQRNRIRAVDELISTEKTYIGKLEMLNDLYVTPMNKGEKHHKLLKKPNHHAILFPVVLHTILALNKKLLNSMEVNTNEIGKALFDFIPYLKMYQNYMNNHEAASRLVKQYRNDKNSEFSKYLLSQELEQSGFTLESYLILPIQRMPRYELCLKEIIKLTQDGHNDKENLIKCYDSVSAVNKQINMRLKDFSTRQQVKQFEMRIINLEINKEKKISIFNKINKRRNSTELQMERTRLVTPSRIFIKQGYLTKVSRKKDIKYLFVLFNDLLIYCSETVNDKLILHQRIDITDEFFRIDTAVVLDDDIDYDDIHADNNKDKKKDKDKSRGNTFEIHSIEKSFLCYAEDNKQREDWIEAILQCKDNIEKSGIEQCKSKNNLFVNNSASMARFNSAPVSTGSSRFDKMMMAATQPSAVDAVEDEGRILETAPMWIPNDWSDECMMPDCENKFSALLLKKRNHCRYCGKLVCSECCTNTLPHYEPKKRNAGVHVKVCKFCHDKYKVKPLMNVEQLHSVGKNMNGKGNSKHGKRVSSSLKIEEEESKSHSSDEWNGLYENMQSVQHAQHAQHMHVQSVPVAVANMNSNAFIKIAQSMSPVISPEPACDGDIESMYETGKKQNNMAQGFHINHAATYGSNYANYNPLLVDNNNARKSPRHGVQVSGGSGGINLPDISPRHGLQGSGSNYSAAFDNIDAMDNPLPDEANSPKLGPVAQAFKYNDIKYDEDMGTVSAIIAANDNLINSMDMSAYGNQNSNKNINNKRVSLQLQEAVPKNQYAKQGNAVVLDENVEAHDSGSDSDDFAANFNNIVIPDSHKKEMQFNSNDYNNNSGQKLQNTNEELYGFMASPKLKAVKQNKSEELDMNNDNVKQLTMFGFNTKQIDDAWHLMKQTEKHKHIVPDHGPMFFETMLDYLNKVQKRKSKSKIMSAYNNDNNNSFDDNINNDFNFQF